MVDNPYLMNEKDVPTNWVPAPKKDPLGASAPPVPNDMPQFFSGSMPPALQHDKMFVGTEVETPRIPIHSLMPLGNQGSGFTNAASQSTAIRVVEAAIAAIPPVVIPPAVSDGVTHGDSIWGLDPAWIVLRDDFAMTSVDVSATVGTFTSEEAWLGIDGSGGKFQPFHSFSFPNFGLLFMGASASADTQSFLIPHLASTSVQQYGWPVFDYPGWKLVWVFGINRKGAGSVPAAFDWSHVSNYIGLGSWPGQTSNTPPIVRPPYFAGLRYDTDATSPAISDTEFTFEYVTQAPVAGAPARNNTQGTTMGTGIHAVEGNYYRFEMTYVADGQLLYSLSDGTTTFTTTFTISRQAIAPTATLSVSNGIATYTSPGSKNQPMSSGSKIILSGITGTASTLNGTWTVMPANLQFLNDQWLTSVTPFGGTAATNGVTSFYPAMVPFVAFGNSSQAGAVTDTKGILVDFFSFVWNPGIEGGTGTPNVNKSRYF